MDIIVTFRGFLIVNGGVWLALLPLLLMDDMYRVVKDDVFDNSAACCIDKVDDDDDDDVQLFLSRLHNK